MNKPKDKVRALSQASKPTVNLCAQFFTRRWRRVLEMLFNVAGAIFFRIDLRRIWRQPLHDDFSVLRQVCCNLFTTVNPGTIPDQDPLALALAPDMLQGADHAVAVHRLVEMALVYFARERQSDGRRQHTPLSRDAAQDRTLCAWGPGPRQWGEERKPRLIIKPYLGAESPRFFLSVASPLRARRESIPRPVLPPPVAVFAA